MKRMFEPIFWGLMVVIWTVLTILEFIKSGEIELAWLAMLLGNCAMFRIALLEARQ
jgi:hypothetical protein